jgi:hypothetical protein
MGSTSARVWIMRQTLARTLSSAAVMIDGGQERSQSRSAGCEAS